MAERLGPTDTCRLVSDVMDRLTMRVQETGGVVVHYAGDGLMALWNAPRDVPERSDYLKLQRASTYVRDLTLRLANDDEAPAWNDKALPPDLDEMMIAGFLRGSPVEMVKCETSDIEVPVCGC